MNGLRRGSFDFRFANPNKNPAFLISIPRWSALVRSDFMVMFTTRCCTSGAVCCFRPSDAKFELEEIPVLLWARRTRGRKSRYRSRTGLRSNRLRHRVSWKGHTRCFRCNRFLWICFLTVHFRVGCSLRCIRCVEWVFEDGAFGGCGIEESG